MTAPKSVDSAGLLREQLEAASPDLLRAMIKTFADAPMSAEADAACGAAYGERSESRVNSRNGYRARRSGGRQPDGSSLTRAARHHPPRP
jgi:transposase-like protein